MRHRSDRIVDTGVLLLVLSLSACGPAERSSERQNADDLVAELVEAARARDSVGLMGLVKWEGVSGEMRASQERSLNLLLEHDVAAIAVEPLPEGYQASRIRSGIEYRANVEVEGIVRVAFGANRPATSESVAMPYGRDAEGYHIAGVTESAAPGGGNHEDVSISIGVIAGGHTEPVSFSGQCTLLRSGSEVLEVVEGEGNLTKAVWGQAVLGCDVLNTSNSGWIELRIDQAGDRVFSSGRVDSPAPVRFQASPTSG